MTDDALRAAVAAGVLASEDSHRALLQATVEVARGIFYAKASSVSPLRRSRRTSSSSRRSPARAPTI